MINQRDRSGSRAKQSARMATRFAVRTGWIAVFLIAAFFALRTFVGDVFMIASGSMRPTLMDHEEQPDRVFVSFTGAGEQALNLKRFDLVVLSRENEREPFVKRAVGLPGETVLVRDGDLFINGEVTGAVGTGVLAPIALFDMQSGDVRAFFAWNQELSRVWSLKDSDKASAAGSVLTLDARQRPIGSFAPALRENVLLEDGYLLSGPSATAGEPNVVHAVDGSLEVGDLHLALELWAAARSNANENSPCGTLRATLTERGDAFHCTVQYVPGAAQLVISRERPAAPDPADQDLPASKRTLPPQVVTQLAETKVSIGATGWQELQFQNVDNVLRAIWNGELALELAYEAHTPHLPPPGSHQRHRKPRLELSGHGKDLIRLRAIQVARDLVYSSHGSFATREPLTLGPDEVFLLGDNSSASRDSREWGPVRMRDLVGRVRAIVWPWSRRRRFD